jgi:hypothetical protein
MYTITFGTQNGWADIARVDGCEAAYAAYRKACELGEMLGVEVALCDAETGEVVACLSDDEDDIPAESIACPTEDWGEVVGSDLVPMPTAGDLAEAWWEG